MSDRHAKVDIDLIGTDAGDLEIYLMERDGSNVRRLTQCGDTARSPAWSPDGLRIAFDCRGLWVMNAAGRNEQRLINHFGSRPAWSPDGSQIAFGGCDREVPTLSPQPEKREVCVIRPDGSSFRPLTQNKVWDGHPDWW